MSDVKEKIAEREDEIRKLYHECGMTQEEIAEEIGCSGSYLSVVMNDLEMETRSRGARNGENHPRWRGGGARDRGWNWRKAREKALKRDGWSCQSCGMGEDEHQERFGHSLHVHHITPYPTFDDPSEANKLSNLITYCKGCHEKVERGNSFP